MNGYIDIYCERLEPGLWAEPVNALTNAAFFIAAFFAFMLARKHAVLNAHTCVLIVLLLLIGTGSTLFHTFATGWAQLSDVLPILLYQIAFIALYARHIIGLSTVKSALMLAAFFASIVAVQQLPEDWLNGSLGYAPALLFMLVLGLWHTKHARNERFGLLAAALTFIVSLTFRSIDMQICDQWPLGTHFLWHCLNGCVLYLTLRAYILNGSKPPKT